MTRASGCAQLVLDARIEWTPDSLFAKARSGELEIQKINIHNGASMSGRPYGRGAHGR
jgi:hypothetical protein